MSLMSPDYRAINIHRSNEIIAEGNDRSQIKNLIEENEMLHTAMKMQSDLLTDAVNLLKGAPEELHQHSHHDIVDAIKTNNLKQTLAAVELFYAELYVVENENINKFSREYIASLKKALEDSQRGL